MRGNILVDRNKCHGSYAWVLRLARMHSALDQQRGLILEAWLLQTPEAFVKASQARNILTTATRTFVRW